MLRNLTIGKKTGLGSGVVIALLTIIGGIIANASEVISGNKLDGNLARMEVDHLNRANQVSAPLADDHECASGQWFYGEVRQEAGKRIPSIAPSLLWSTTSPAGWNWNTVSLRLTKPEAVSRAIPSWRYCKTAKATS